MTSISQHQGPSLQRTSHSVEQGYDVSTWARQPDRLVDSLCWEQDQLAQALLQLCPPTCSSFLGMRGGPSTAQGTTAQATNCRVPSITGSIAANRHSTCWKCAKDEVPLHMEETVMLCEQQIPTWSPTHQLIECKRATVTSFSAQRRLRAPHDPQQWTAFRKTPGRLPVCLDPQLPGVIKSDQRCWLSAAPVLWQQQGADGGTGPSAWDAPGEKVHFCLAVTCSHASEIGRCNSELFFKGIFLETR